MSTYCYNTLAMPALFGDMLHACHLTLPRTAQEATAQECCSAPLPHSVLPISVSDSTLNCG